MNTTFRCSNHGLSYAFMLPVILAGIIFMILSGCTHTKTVRVPGPPVVAKVPVPVPCQIEQVVATPRLTAPKGSNIFDLAKTVAADRRRLMAENERLRSATNNPCPVR